MIHERCISGNFPENCDRETTFDTPDAVFRPVDGTAAGFGGLFSFVAETQPLFTASASLPLVCDIGELATGGLLAVDSVSNTTVVDSKSGEFSESSVCISSGHCISSNVSSPRSTWVPTADEPRVVLDLSAAICRWTATVLACSQSSATWYGDNALSLRNVSSSVFSLINKHKRGIPIN